MQLRYYHIDITKNVSGIVWGDILSFFTTILHDYERAGFRKAMTNINFI